MGDGECFFSCYTLNLCKLFLGHFSSFSLTLALFFHILPLLYHPPTPILIYFFLRSLLFFVFPPVFRLLHFSPPPLFDLYFSSSVPPLLDLPALFGVPPIFGLKIPLSLPTSFWPPTPFQTALAFFSASIFSLTIPPTFQHPTPLWPPSCFQPLYFSELPTPFGPPQIFSASTFLSDFHVFLSPKLF